MNLKELLVEFIASFQLFFLGTSAFVYSEYNPEFGPLSVGIVFGVSVYIGIMLFTKISIGHMSPSVTAFGMLLTEVKPKNGFLLILVQLIASICAALLLSAIIKNSDSSLGLTVPHAGLWQTWLIEFIGSSILLVGLYLVYQKSYFLIGLIAGSTVALMDWFAIPLTGGCFNAARYFGPALVKGDFTHLFLYVSATMSSVLVAWLISRLIPKKTLHRFYQ